MSAPIDWAAFHPAAVPAVIFLLRAADLTMSTLRMLTALRGNRLGTWLLGFGQALLFVTGIAGVLTNLQNPLNLLAYAGGFAVGSVLGISIESVLAPGHSELTIVSEGRGAQIAEALRGLGKGVTALPGRGMQGTVNMLLCIAPRKEVRRLKQLAVEIDPHSFLAVENVRSLRGGWRA